MHNQLLAEANLYESMFFFSAKRKLKLSHIMGT